MPLPDPLLRLVEELQRLPGIGSKSAQRLAFHILKTPREETDRLADAVREIRPSVPIILMTGYSKTLTPERVRALGIAAVLQKPVGIDDLVGAVDTACERLDA